jgi:uncharacterized membrane protein YccC
MVHIITKVTNISDQLGRSKGHSIPTPHHETLIQPGVTVTFDGHLETIVRSNNHYAVNALGVLGAIIQSGDLKVEYFRRFADGRDVLIQLPGDEELKRADKDMEAGKAIQQLADTNAGLRNELEATKSNSRAAIETAEARIRDLEGKVNEISFSDAANKTKIEELELTLASMPTTPPPQQQQESSQSARKYRKRSAAAEPAQAGQPAIQQPAGAQEVTLDTGDGLQA